MFHGLQLVMRSVSPWQSLARCDELVDRLAALGDFVLPEKFGDHEPARHRLDLNNRARLHQIWQSRVGGVFFQRRKPAVTWLTFLLLGPQLRRPCELLGGFDERYGRGENLGRLLEAARQIYHWGEVDHGFIAHDHDWNAKNYFGVPTTVAGGRTLSSGGLHLEDGLPGIYWANFFGPRYVEFLGSERMASAPAHHKEPLQDGGWLLLTSPGPLDHGLPATRACEQALLEHLGRDAFFDRGQPTRVCRAPDLGLGGSPSYEAGIDPIQMVIPSVDAFLVESARLAQALVERLDGALDYSVASLATVDSFILKRSSRRHQPWLTSQGRGLLRELTAYYGEVLRQNLGGKWTIDPATSHPAIEYRKGGELTGELPFTRVIRLWCERDPGDSLVATFRMSEAGVVSKVQSFLNRFF